MSNIEKVVYGGQCHCGAVKFRVRAPKRLVAWLCNCSICEMKKNTHFVVPSADFILLPLVPEDSRLNADEAMALASQSSTYPAHWGEPPRAQTRDLRDLPGGYGQGSGTLAKWIQTNMDIDSGPSQVEEAAHGGITTYTFNTHTAKHTFCATCGVQSFYHPRSNPDGVGVTLSCLIPSVPVVEPDAHPPEGCACEVRAFDGQNWEQYYAGAGSAIKSFSKTER